MGMITEKQKMIYLPVQKPCTATAVCVCSMTLLFFF